MPPLSSRSRRTTAALVFVVVSAVAGLLAAGLVLPAVAAATWATGAAEDELETLPVAFDVPAQSQRSRVLDADGDVLATFFAENRVYVELDEIAPVMREAIISIEDHRYYEHGPIDPIGTLRAFLRNQAADDTTQGGSSITQQYVKMVQVEEAAKAGDEQAVEEARAGTYTRKIKELRYAVSVEQNLSKDEILERYLNIAYYGDGAYGVQAAAEHYFGTTAKKLTLPQAAMLAGLVQNPTAFNPVENEDAGLQRRDVVLARMAQLGTITAAQAKKAQQAGFDEDDVETTTSGCTVSDFPFLCDYVYKTLLQTPSLGASPDEREQAVLRGGLTIQTALDPDTQAATQDAVSDVVGPTDPLIAVMDMVEPGTGRVLAMAQSRPVMGSDAEAGETYWNYSVPPALGGAQGFQAGSTFKAFTAAAALEDGMPLSTRYDARRTIDFSGATFESCEGTQQVNGEWEVSNSTGTNGVMDMNLAAQRSVNTYFVRLALDVGLCDVTKMAEKLGVQSSTADAPVSSYDDKPSFTLGTVEVDPLSMATAYATFASGGIHCDPVVLDSITDTTGAELEVPDGNCERVLSEDVANAMNSLLAGVMTQGTGGRVATSDGRPQAGKTGTIDSNAATWFVGYTPEAAGAAMISVDNARKPFVSDETGYRRSGLKNFVVPSTGDSLEGSGSGDAGLRIWKPAMESYLDDEPATRFDAPPASLVRGDGSTLNGRSGAFGGQPGQQLPGQLPGQDQGRRGPR